VRRLKKKYDRHNSIGQLIKLPSALWAFHSAFRHFLPLGSTLKRYRSTIGLRGAQWNLLLQNYAQKLGILLTPEAPQSLRVLTSAIPGAARLFAKKKSTSNVQACWPRIQPTWKRRNGSSSLNSCTKIRSFFNFSEMIGALPVGHVSLDETFAFSPLAKVNYKGCFTIEGFTPNESWLANSIGVLEKTSLSLGNTWRRHGFKSWLRDGGEVWGCSLEQDDESV